MKAKKGAMELSIGTIVIIVLAMSMLILGLVLIKTIFVGAKYNVDTIEDLSEGGKVGFRGAFRGKGSN